MMLWQCCVMCVVAGEFSLFFSSLFSPPNLLKPTAWKICPIEATFSGCGLQLRSRWGCNSGHVMITWCNSGGHGNSTNPRSFPSQIVKSIMNVTSQIFCACLGKYGWRAWGMPPNETTCPSWNFPPRQLDCRRNDAIYINFMMHKTPLMVSQFVILSAHTTNISCRFHFCTPWAGSCNSRCRIIT